MSSRNLARRTKAEISFGGIDITKSIQPYLLSISYTDNEEDETDDLQIKIQDRDDLWLTQWLDEISEKLSWASPSGGSASGDAVVSEANKYLGTPYVWGGSSPSGFDCSGLVYYALNEAGISVPRTTAQGYKDMATPVNEATAQPGDLIFFGTQGVVDHVGIYMGNGQMVNATGSCVQITDINTRRAGIISWGRIGGATQSGSAASAQAGTQSSGSGSSTSSGEQGASSDGGGALLGRAALEVAESGGGHRAGRAHLGLTAALRARESGAGRDDLTEPGGDIEGVADGLFVGLAAAGQRQQNSGQDAAAARRGGSDDALHAGVALGGLESFGSHCGEVIAAKALSFLMGLLHLGRIAARKAASAALGRVIVPAGGLHHLPEVVHHLPAVGLGEAALGQIAAEDGLRKGNILATGSGQHLFTG